MAVIKSTNSWVSGESWRAAAQKAPRIRFRIEQ